jgi:hypothetical protein
MDLLMFDEHTTPNESLDSLLKFSGGAGPGGVIGRGRRVGIVMVPVRRVQSGLVFFASSELSPSFYTIFYVHL